MFGKLSRWFRGRKRKIVTAIGISAQRITDDNPSGYPLILGGVRFESVFWTMAEWYEKWKVDGDALLHALTRALQQLDLCKRDIMGQISTKMIREEGISDSAEFLKLAVKKCYGNRRQNYLRIYYDPGKSSSFQSHDSRHDRKNCRIVGS